MSSHRIIPDGYWHALEVARNDYRLRLTERFLTWRRHHGLTISLWERVWIHREIEKRVKRLQLTATGQRPSNSIL